jgi:hypothetical protein
MKFENTITLGNVLTAISMTLAGAALWTNTSERIARNEQAISELRANDTRHEVEMRVNKDDTRALMLEIKSDIKELRNDIKQRR